MLIFQKQQKTLVSKPIHENPNDTLKEKSSTAKTDCIISTVLEFGEVTSFSPGSGNKPLWSGHEKYLFQLLCVLQSNIISNSSSITHKDDAFTQS